MKSSTTESQSKIKKEVDKCKNTLEGLRGEMSFYSKNSENTIKFIESKKNSLLGEIISNNRRDVSKYLIQV
jgi:hypothetical protein